MAKYEVLMGLTQVAVHDEQKHAIRDLIERVRKLARANELSLQYAESCGVRAIEMRLGGHGPYMSFAAARQYAIKMEWLVRQEDGTYKWSWA